MWTVRLCTLITVVVIGGLSFFGTPVHVRAQDMSMPMNMGMMGMHRMCPMMGEGVKIEIKELEDGISITYRASDPREIKRLKIMARMIKLMKEMMELQ